MTYFQQCIQQNLPAIPCELYANCSDIQGGIMEALSSHGCVNTNHETQPPPPAPTRSQQLSHLYWFFGQFITGYIISAVGYHLGIAERLLQGKRLVYIYSIITLKGLSHQIFQALFASMDMPHQSPLMFVIFLRLYTVITIFCRQCEKQVDYVAKSVCFAV